MEIDEVPPEDSIPAGIGITYFGESRAKRYCDGIGDTDSCGGLLFSKIQKTGLLVRLKVRPTMLIALNGPQGQPELGKVQELATVKTLGTQNN